MSSLAIVIAGLCLGIPLMEWWRRSLLRRERIRTREAIQAALSDPPPPPPARGE